jgi:hypothetical protein
MSCLFPVQLIIDLLRYLSQLPAFNIPQSSNARILSKLGVNDRTQAVIVSVKRGIVSL